MVHLQFDSKGKFILKDIPCNNYKCFISENLSLFYCKYLYQFEVLKIVYDFLKLNDSTNHYFKSYITLDDSNVYRNTRNFTYVSSNGAKKSFLYNGTQLWLNLPKEISEINNCDLFKKTLREYLIELQTLELDLQSKSEEYCNLSCIESVVNMVS